MNRIEMVMAAIDKNKSKDAQRPDEPVVMPVAWMHNEDGRLDVIHNVAKELWLNARPQHVEHYTIPLYSHEKRAPMSTQEACDLCRSVGLDPEQNGNILKLLRCTEIAHGIKA